MKLLKYFILVIAAFQVLACTTASKSPSEEVPLSVSAKPYQTGFAPVNGINMYYEIYGKSSGIPLVLLHGGGSTIDVTFSKVIPLFAQNHKVIAIEEEGHGRSSGRSGPIRFTTSADDVATLLRHLKIEQADLFGFSNGASVALQVALRHPELVRKLIFASSISKKQGAYPWFWEMMKKNDLSTVPQPLKDAFLKVNPDPEKLKRMLEKDAERMKNFVDVKDKDLKSVRASTLILFGDKELVKLEHGVELTRLIKDSRLLIVPGGHGDYLGEAVTTQRETQMPKLTVGLIEEFLALPSKRSEISKDGL